MESTASGFKAFSVLTFSWPVSQNLVNWVKMGKVIKMEGEGRTQARKIIRRKEKGVGGRCERFLKEKRVGGRQESLLKGRRGRTQARRVI